MEITSVHPNRNRTRNIDRDQEKNPRKVTKTDLHIIDDRDQNRRVQYRVLKDKRIQKRESNWAMEF
jgi:hypothetical protein